MSIFSDCPKCWDTPCTCGHMYASWSVDRLREQIKVLQNVLNQKTLPLPQLPGSWPEDTGLENGNYECKCVSCGGTFYGHKRRVTCKECSTRAQPGGEGFVMVPREFLAQIRTLAHNYPMAQADGTAYYGVECDAFKEAYRRAGNDLKSALAMLPSALRAQPGGEG